MEWIFLFAIGAIGAVIWSAIRGAGWRTSSGGNQTRLYKGSRITVFESDGGWKYCIADPDDRTPPYFSDPYSSQEAATHEAMVFMDGGESRYQTKRESRQQKISEGIPERVAKEIERYDKIKQSVVRVLKTPTTKITSLQNLSKSLTVRIRASDHLHGQMARADADEGDFQRIGNIILDYSAMKRDVDGAIASAPPRSDN